MNTNIKPERVVSLHTLHTIYLNLWFGLGGRVFQAASYLKASENAALHIVLNKMRYCAEDGGVKRVLVILCLLGMVSNLSSVRAEVVYVGSGGYRTTVPSHCKPLPKKIYKTGNVTGPTLTSQWWSSLIWQKYSQNMFAHPAFMRCDADGLVVGYQGGHIHGNGVGIFGNADLVKGDFKIHHSEVSNFPDANCDHYSDWFVTAAFEFEDQSLKTSFGHGSPYVYGLIEGGDPEIRFSAKPNFWSGSTGDSVIGVSIHGHHYGLFGSEGSSWEGIGTDILTNTNRKHAHFSIAVLPDNKVETLRLFEKYAHAHVTDTRLEWTVEDGKVDAKYHITCQPKEGDETNTLYSLYPHQWKYTHSELTEMSYDSVRGKMKVAIGNGFSTVIPIQGVLPLFPSSGIRDKEVMLGLLENEAFKFKKEYADTYWEGKYLGSLTSLSGTSEAVGSKELQTVFLNEIQGRLENWFSAKANKNQPVFYYDNNWGTLVGSRPSYGSDMPINDHHFHYGYFIRAAAEIARVNPDWAKEWGPMVRLLIRDIASPNRNDKEFPYLRCFDRYAGHSWASGDANFADGNNQESSSESLNAWYGMMLWGEITGDKAIRDLGIALFNTERVAVEEYWLDVSETNYPSGFPNVALGMIWGGKGAFQTWFSGEIDFIHGINWLPFTPASVHLGRHPDYVEKNYQMILSKRKGGKDFNTDWGDLVLMFGALNDPAPAIAHLDSEPECKIESGNSRAFMEHWIGTLHKFGHIDNKTTSAHQFTNVFSNKGKLTYVAYNFSDEPISVNFSDGYVLKAAPRSLSVSEKD